MIMTKYTDWHSHILPGIDDGSQHRQDSIEALQAALECGIGRIVATPHFYPHKNSVDRFLERRNNSYDHLMRKVVSLELTGLPEIRKGAEVLLCGGLDNMEGYEKLCIEGTNIMMVELPFVESEHTDEMFETVYRLINDSKISVIMVHPHRYSDRSVMRMLDLGAMLQLNAGDVTSLSGRGRAKKYIEMGKVCCIGTDFHRDVKVFEKYRKAMRTFGDRLAVKDPSFSLDVIKDDLK